MNTKSKYILFSCILFATLGISLTSIQLNTIITNPIVTEPIIDVKQPHTSAQTVNSIEFVQGGRTFVYDPNNESNNYFKTGEGPFTIRFYFGSNDLSDNFFNPTRLQLALKGFDPSYHSTLHLDTAMMDELPAALQVIIGLIPYAELALHSTSRNEIVRTISYDELNSAPFVAGKGYLIEWTPSLTDTYNYQTRIYLGEYDLTQLLEDLGLEDLVASFLPDLYPTEVIQEIKYNVINMISVTKQIYQLLQGGWNNVQNGVTYDGVTKTTHEFDVINDDVTAPSYLPPEASQETAVDDWQIKVRLYDEAEGSGVKNDSVYIWYSVNGGTYQMIEDPMLLGDDFYFYGTLPSQLANSEIKYYITFSDRAGNDVQTATYTFYANPLEIQPVAILLIGIAIATIATIAATRIYRNRHQPRVITLPSKKKVDKYYKNIKKEGGSM